MFTAISKADRGLIFSAGPPRTAGHVPFIRLLVAWAVLWLPCAHAEIPRVEITTSDGQYVLLPGPPSEKAAAFLQNYDEEKRNAFYLKRDRYLRVAASGLSSWYRNLKRIEWLSLMLHSICSVQPPPPLTQELREAIIYGQMAEFDDALFENIDMVLDASQVGFGASIGPYLSGGLRQYSYGFGESLFMSYDFNPWKRKSSRVRVGHEHERLRHVEPFLIGTGIGVRIFIYVTVPDHNEPERGSFLSPLVGPSFMKTNKTVAISKWFGLNFSTPFPLVVQTDILRRHHELGTLFARLKSAAKTCGTRMLSFAGIRPHLEEPPGGGGEGEVAINDSEPEIREQMPRFAEAAAQMK